MIGLQVPDLSSMLRNGLQTPLNVRGENSGPASGSSHIGALQEAVLVEEHCVPSGTALCQCKCPRQLLRGSLVPPPPPTSWVHHRRLHLCTLTIGDGGGGGISGIMVQPRFPRRGAYHCRRPSLRPLSAQLPHNLGSGGWPQ